MTTLRTRTAGASRLRLATVRRAVRRSANDEGTSLIETMAALTILLVVMAGLMSMDAVAMKITENYGHLAARTAEYAQDKMEQLLGLAWGDITSDTRVFPALAAGGTGLAVGGSFDPSAPVDGYVDYLDQDGALLAAGGGGAPAGWYYKRVWAVSIPSVNLKQITVTVAVARGFGSSQPVRSTVVALKSFPF
jgi:hypothetical protein